MTPCLAFSRKTCALIVVLAVSMLSACDNAQERTAAHVERGAAFFEAGNYDRARIELKNALQITPTNARAYYYLGRVYEEQQLWPEAIRAFSLAVDQAPDHVDANIRLGRYYVLGNQLSKALERAEHVISLSNGESAEGYALRASVALARHRRDEARQDARLALDMDPGNATATSVLVGLYRKDGRLAEAVEVVAQALEKDPAHIALRLTKVGLHLDLNQKTEAEADAIALTKFEPGVLRHRVNLARLYVRWGRLDDAENVLRKTVERHNQSSEARLALVDFLVNQRGSEAAEKALTGFIGETPEDHVLRFALAEIYRRDGKKPAAKVVLNEIAKIWQGKKEARRAQASLAGMLLAEDRIEEAKRTVTAVLDAEPENPVALMLRARIALREKQFDDAIRTLRTILRERPDSSEVLKLLSDAYLAHGKKELAVDTLNRLVETNPADVDTRIQLAQLLAEDRQFDSTIKLLDDVLERNPRDLRALAIKAEILIVQDNFDQAMTLARQIEQLPHGETISLKLRGRLAAARSNHKEAVAAFRNAMAAAPDDWQAIEGLTWSLAASGRREEAASLLREVVSRAPEHRRAWIRLGDMLSTEDPAGAIKAYDAAIGIDRQLVEAHARLVSLHFRLGNDEKALAALQRAADANPDKPGVAISLALALQRAGRFQDAIRIYEDLRARGHEDVAVVNNLAALIADHAYEDEERIAQAIRMMEPYQASENALIIDTIGWLHYRAGNLVEAVSFLKRAVTLDDSNPELRRHLSKAYQRAGKDELAARYQTSSSVPSPDAADLQNGEDQ